MKRKLINAFFMPIKPFATIQGRLKRGENPSSGVSMGALIQAYILSICYEL
jgi:hypothetical protein